MNFKINQKVTFNGVEGTIVSSEINGVLFEGETIINGIYLVKFSNTAKHEDTHWNCNVLPINKKLLKPIEPPSVLEIPEITLAQKDKVAEKILNTLSRQVFADWHNGFFGEYITGSKDYIRPTKEQVKDVIIKFFRL